MAGTGIVAPHSLTNDAALQYFFSLEMPSKRAQFDQSYIKDVRGNGAHTWTITTGALKQGAYKIQYPAAVDAGTLTIVFFEDHIGTVQEMLREWQDDIFNPATNTYFPTSNYHEQIDLTVYNMNNEPIRVVTYNNCFPIQVVGYQYSTEEANHSMQITVTFATSGFSVQY